MNVHAPLIGLALQSNSDAQGICTRDQAEQYCCKYCSKHCKRCGCQGVIYDLIDEMEAKDDRNEKEFGEGMSPSRFGEKLHKVFMAEIGEEMCQGEVSHYANRCPSYLLSRPQKHVSLYKKFLYVPGTQNCKRGCSNCQDEDQEDQEENMDEDEVGNRFPKRRRKRRFKGTSPSDIDIYELRVQWGFEGGVGVCPALPLKDSPEEQVAELSLYDFFRYVKFKGGRKGSFVCLVLVEVKCWYQCVHVSSLIISVLSSCGVSGGGV